MKRGIAVLLFFTFLTLGFCILLSLEENFNDPVKVFYQWSGWIAYGALLGCLILPWGKWWGIFALLVSLLHLSVFVFFDFYFEWGLMFGEFSKKPYIYAGAGALVLMVILGIFSLGKHFYSSLKYGVWGAMICSLVHLVMIQKVLSLQIWGVIVVSLAVLGFKILKSLCKPF